MSNALASEYDYIIVGAGSAGCVMANRLSADGSKSILLVEAGPMDNSLFIKMPAAFTYAVGDRRFDWGYSSEQEPYADNRRILCPRGRVVGGSSSVNAMSFVRGHALDFDKWAEQEGLGNWSYSHCLPYFRKMENFSGGADNFRGANGPLHVTAPRFSNPLCDVFVKACERSGYSWSEDTNGEQQEGFGVMEQTIHKGSRESSASAYLHPAMDRENLTVITNALTRKIIFEGQDAQGIEVLHEGNTKTLLAAEGVILCAGAINSPQLLMLSGIGEAAHLREYDIDIVVDLSGVGKNLQDHVEVNVRYECLQPVTTTSYLKPHRKAFLGLQWLLTKKGLGATNHFEVAGYIRSSPDVEHPDLQIVFVPLLVNRDGAPYSGYHGFQATISLLRPKSRGQIRLNSPDSTVAPKILFNYLQHPQDTEDLRAGINKTREIFQALDFDPFRGDEVEPGEALSDCRGLNNYIRRTVNSTHHPSCTCRMGEGDDAVVNGEGQVHGVSRLWVIDASIMPNITSGNINAPVMMLAEKIADTILVTDNETF